ncbi:hypothetical protein SPRG_15819 [Saprolegnia parasitica CBS 223.65]|uniref:Uncharacterized protein n=1 Tax=Saprolegnia parasitica (strain CBS 223.65) TaxID=695850 RepID=A0A067BX64_SAPPC|nr:hypothetical protein SPRG_15819 [Saprolegnia parasitica CBS 223.65]KDO18896.1 hypothetical protein SPRG_15819 [Saprolegnia parasitica CBS 223.65]|eukprot:XP_012210389.1 hypothetical protein SPRG_15819 [Saprolegnia parasitica CBS 223.65]
MDDVLFGRDDALTSLLLDDAFASTDDAFAADAFLSECFFSSAKDGKDHNDASPTTTRRQVRDRRHRAKLKSELDTLRETAASLTQCLEALQTTQLHQDETSSAWQQRARRQATQLQRSIQENHKLREAVTGQLSMAHAFQRIAAKRPRHPELQGDKTLPFYSLMHAPCRRTSLRALVTREVSSLNTTLLRFGLLDGPMRCEVVRRDSISGAVEIVYSRPVALSASAAVTALWQRLCGKVAACRDYTSLEDVGDDLGYSKYATSVFESRLALLRTALDGHSVLVWRSILEDDRFPLGDDTIHDNSSGWLRIESVTAATCHVTMAVHSLAPPDASASSHVHLAHAIETYQVRRVDGLYDALPVSTERL